MSLTCVRKSLPKAQVTYREIPGRPRRLSSTPIVMHNRAIFDPIGRGGHTLQRWENDASRMCGQSCTNRPDICPTSGWHRAMTFEVGRLFVIGQQSADHRTSAGRFQRTSPDDLPTIMGDIIRFHSWLGDAPSRQSVDRCPAVVHDVRAGITRLPVDGSTIEKNW